MRTTLAWIITGVLTGLAGACSSEALHEPSSTEETSNQKVSCATLVDLLTECDLLTGTRLAGCTDDDAVLPCASACVADATCSQVASAYCDNVLNSFSGCLNECQMALAPPPFICDDGSRLQANWQCDGFADCAGSEDELDCPDNTFICEDGAGILATWKCDGEADCAGGEDELNCPEGALYTCRDGATILADAECDGELDCAAGEDEVDCAFLNCP